MTDSEGYTQDSLQGANIFFSYWDDSQARMVTLKMNSAIQLADYNAQKLVPTFISEWTDPMFHGPTEFFSRLMTFTYRDKVTGQNLATLSNDLWSKIDSKVKSALNALVQSNQAVKGWTLNLTPEGDYFAKFDSSGPDDILMLKYVTHGNYIKATINLDFLGTLLDPLSLLSGDPSFTVTFDMVTRVDVRLPKKSGDGFQVIRAETTPTGLDVHAENIDAALIKLCASGAIQDGMNADPQDFTAQIQGKIQSSNGLLGQMEQYNETTYDVADDLLQMTFIQHPYRDISISLDYLQDLNPRRVNTTVNALIGQGNPPEEFLLGIDDTGEHFIPVGKRFDNGDRYFYAAIDIERNFINNVVGGHLVDLGGVYYIYYDDGEILSLGADFNPNSEEGKLALSGLIPKRNPTPPGKPGVARTVFLYIDYLLQTVTGRYTNLSFFSVNAGDQIRVPGDNNIIPEIWFTVRIAGPRHGKAPTNELPSRPPLIDYVAVYVAPPENNSNKSPVVRNLVGSSAEPSPDGHAVASVS